MARKHFSQSEQVLQELVAASPASVAYRNNLLEVQEDLDGLGKES
jgi:hypothetical protein